MGPADRLLVAVDVARAAAVEFAGEEQVGEHEGAVVEEPTREEQVGEHQGAVVGAPTDAAPTDAAPSREAPTGEQPTDVGAAVTHRFASRLPGYRGWSWAITVAQGDPEAPVTVSEVVQLPGPDALVAPTWVPWQDRVRAGDLGVGDLLPTPPDDPRLVPGYVGSDDPAVEEVATEVGLGRRQVLSREGRLDAAHRWQHGPRGPGSEMARSAPGTCGTCGYYLPLAGTMRAGFGVCGNEFAPADGSVVAVEHGCGAHSDVLPDTAPSTPVAELVYDDGVDVEPASVDPDSS